ncbi:hypothetical protein PGB28_19990 [Primorskyibacter aestuariivivens]|uniref:hypothetical protein n=1 Tax=Primorskyibacter aestuariivivens TaxID=1888912 RepID=UPI002301E036|nr:hypothetical protein [Primorskyibacter aestuariivivens]MDA7430749.1 hypothetical protein [Primorskyibacter aestuariivivens]
MTQTPLFAALAVATGLMAGAALAQSRTPDTATPMLSTQGGAASAYMTTADGCTYRRAQAPGYAPTWILVLNPHHIGRPNSPRHCPGMRQ